MVTSELQERVQRRLGQLVGSGAESGLQVAVYQGGTLIVDAVAGTADPGTGRALSARTPIFGFSIAKNVTATLAHLLVARGHLGYDTPVREVWPEFGANGKGAATLRHVLTHTVGLPAMPAGITPRELPDWPAVCAALADAEPRWAPGTAMGYHSYTFGFLAGELARRATGRPLRELLREWITTPLGIDGQLQFGVAPESLPEPARLTGETPRPGDGTGTVLAPWESRPDAGFGNTAEILGADIPSVGSVTAHGLAAMFDALLRGELVDPAALAGMSAVAYDGVDQVLGTPARMTLGFPAGRIGAPAGEGSVAFGWPGGGGGYAYADPAHGVAFALTKTRLTAGFDTVLSITALLADHLATPRTSLRGFS
ncbi:serine hydrolase domain-containing protein [Actinoplanes philippinensis]|uniref:serine hydrolase domain-containing protein n=1 Tax=Actinoplanes philippinensis TaxID=35752 RepID=UPI0033FBE211